MRTTLLAGALSGLILLSACGGNGQAQYSEADTKENVQQYYNEISALDETSKSALEDFNEALTDYSGGTLSADELENAIETFQNTAADLAKQADKIKVSSRFPDDVEKLLIEANESFQNAYDLKKDAAQSADSPSVTADQFDQMNKNADIVMLYGISKLNEARQAVGLLEDSSASPSAGATAAPAGTASPASATAPGATPASDAAAN